MRRVGRENPTDRSDRTDQSDAKAYSKWLNHTDPAVVANTLICLIHQANYLLDRQIAGLEKQFIQEGGYSERLHAARLEERQKQARHNPSDRTDQTDRPDEKLCPVCGKLMVVRTARQGSKAGSQFWGCSGYPECKSTQPVT